MNKLYWGIPLLLFIVMAPFTPYLDIAISSYFYKKGHFSQNAFYAFLYDYGPFPGIVTAGVASTAFIFSYFFSYLKKWRLPALVLFLTMVIGAGFIVHGVLKDYWGRPRPKQIVQFGGTEEYRPFYLPNFNASSPLRSFSCGHCSAGFYFFSFVVLGYRLKNRLLLYLGIILSLFLGISLSMTRIAQGGHFFSDTIASAVIMWYTALICDWLINPEK